MIGWRLVGRGRFWPCGMPKTASREESSNDEHLSSLVVPPSPAEPDSSLFLLQIWERIWLMISGVRNRSSVALSASLERGAEYMGRQRRRQVDLCAAIHW
jgi:hypothetical protein